MRACPLQAKGYQHSFEVDLADSQDKALKQLKQLTLSVCLTTTFIK